jgi:DNA-binding transcriptional LysR family regulator
MRRSFDGVAVFVAVAELGGFRAASRHLQVTPSAVSQAIQALEETIGIPLFVRTTRSVRLTDAGQRLLAHARPSLEMLRAGIAAATGMRGEVRERLRVNAPIDVLPMLTEHLFPDFFTTYPAIQLELAGDSESVDIMSEAYDLAFHQTGFAAANMVSVSLTPSERLVVVGAPDFLATRGSPAQPTDLMHWPCIVFNSDALDLTKWHFSTLQRPLVVTVDGPLVSNDIRTAISAAVSGVGLVQLRQSLVRKQLDSGALATVLDDFATMVPGLSLHYPKGAEKALKLRSFVGFAIEQFRKPWT